MRSCRASEETQYLNALKIDSYLCTANARMYLLHCCDVQKLLVFLILHVKSLLHVVYQLALIHLAYLVYKSSQTLILY